MPNRLGYDAELEQLEDTYQRTLAWDIEPLRRALSAVAGGPAVFIGTGGTLAVAHLAAQLHEQFGGQPSRVVTPLELVRLPPTLQAGAVLFSAGAKHPDAIGVLERLGAGRFQPAVLLTLRDPADMAGWVSLEAHIVALPSLHFREGFLATNSLLSMMVALIRAHAGDESLPSALPRPDVELPASDTENLLVLATPDLAAVGVDLETRCAELGLACVQVTDYRNFAHGRHVGLSRRARNTAVVGLVAEPLEKLATATLNVLPMEIEKVAWRARHTVPVAVLELTLASMALAGKLAAAQGVNATRPGAAPYGRRLYHLSMRSVLPEMEDGPVQRKIAALGAGTSDSAVVSLYDDSYQKWSEQISLIEFGGVVLDYDGTVCATTKRFDLPPAKIQTALISLLDAGVGVGIASGRGKSLYWDLRQWVPERHWGSVVVGLYNGGARVLLSDELPDLAGPTELMSSVAKRIGELPIGPGGQIEARSVQVTVSVSSGAFAHVGRLAKLVANAMAQPPALPVKVVASAHSVDLVAAETTKVTIAQEIEASTGLPVLAIGDQGDIGGNDFELLASRPWTLTVDRCSPDPSRCWYLDKRGRTGPRLLEAYLGSVSLSSASLRFVWKSM